MVHILDREMVVIVGQQESFEGQSPFRLNGHLTPDPESIAYTLGRSVALPKDLLKWMRYQPTKCEIIVISNCQELSNEAIEILADAVASGDRTVVLSGIDTTDDGHVFENTGLAMAYADKVIKFDARKPKPGAFSQETNEHTNAGMKEETRRGKLDVICGCMFAGKTGELISRSRLADFEGLKPLIFRPSIDTRGSKDTVITHDRAKSFPAITISRASEINDIIDPSNNRFVAIDEAQFLEGELSETVSDLKASGINVLISTLDRDWRGRTWRAVPKLLALADNVTKMKAQCGSCGNPASMSFRKITGANKIHIGGSEAYEPRCKSCYRLG